MDIINLQLDQSYLDRAKAELCLPNFPSTEIIGKIYDAMGGTVEHSQKMESMITWIKLLEKKYQETVTSIVYGLAHHYKQQDEGFHSPSDPFYHPQVSYFTENAVSRSFSLAEKLAQLINVWKELGMPESGSPRIAVSFKKVRERSVIDLSAFGDSLDTLSPERHSHTHGLNPEMSRPKVSSVGVGKISSDERPVEVIMHSFDESKLPVTPYQQLLRCKNVMGSFTTTVSTVFDDIEESLEP
ncbi:Cthe_2314 family HEPN domain-containing protein [Paenibacillus piri]|uniref:Cthe-2314-like HEPN domain-containing protein n=1 Tax=Paenibacillus piri TaxID=2547395 RepID=A0A4R5KJP2_9BACL|nr:Cthe_2314 family HEPN domain-containing protein [Paenibacillus piri]TDF94677.1 hypothetical protein E1757_22185 [Paenibacillus piri]